MRDQWTEPTWGGIEGGRWVWVESGGGKMKTTVLKH